MNPIINSLRFVLVLITIIVLQQLFRLCTENVLNYWGCKTFFGAPIKKIVEIIFLREKIAVLPHFQTTTIELDFSLLENMKIFEQNYRGC